jgi:tetratricopeptide (TPR) repeat protein
VRRLVALYDEIEAGATVFVTGDEGDGREPLLRAVAAELRDRDAIVVAGRFERENFEPWTSDLERPVDVLGRLQRIVPLAEPLLAVLQLFSLLVSQSPRASQLVSRLGERNGQVVDPGLLLPQLLQLAAQDRPVVCLVDCAEDAAAGWWEDLLTLFAGAIAEPVPVLLVVGVEAELRRDDVPRGQYAAEELVQRGLAKSWPLERIGHDDLEAWVGRADPQVFEALLDGSRGGHSVLAALLWRAWQAGGVVEREADGPWRFSEDGEPGIVAARLGGDERAREVLTVAALEGPQFTAEALAHALESDRDELVDYLDDVLVEAELVEEAGLITIESEQGTHHLWRYRFVSDLDRLSLRHTLTGPEGAARSERLAHGLVAAYGAASDVVSATVARLFDAGGDAELAATFWARTRIGGDANVVLWRASRLLQVAPPVSPLERQTAAEVLVAAARLLFRGPFDQGLKFAQAALRDALDGSEDQGAAYYFSGWFEVNLEQYAEARRDLDAALEAATRTGASARMADAIHQLANVDFVEGDYASAQRRFTEVLTVRRRLADSAGEAHALAGLGAVDWQGGDPAAARDRYQAALQLSDGDPVFRFQLHVRLAETDAALGDGAAGLAHLHEALRITRSLGDAGGEREILQLIAAQGET